MYTCVVSCVCNYMYFVLGSYGNVFWFHVAEVGFLPLAHEVKVKGTVAEGAGGHDGIIEWEPCFLPHLHKFICE